MAWYKDFLDWLIPAGDWTASGQRSDTIIIDIPAELYYKDLAVYTATSLISNAISRSEVKTYENFKPVKKDDYYLLNVSPNRNETSSLFWHRVINKMIRHGEALVVAPADGFLYCADSFIRVKEQPILGDVYSSVTVDTFVFNRSFKQDDSYLFRLDDQRISQLIDGMYMEYGKILASAAKALKQSNGQKHKLHIQGVKAGDEKFNEEFEGFISQQLKTYMEADAAVYPEFDGYKLEADNAKLNKSSDDFVKLKKELTTTVAAAFHIPESMMTGNITSMNDIVGSFLTFGVDPYADAITESLNKRAGTNNYVKGNYYKVDTGKIQHRSLFDLAVACMNLISSGVMCVDEIREELDYVPLNQPWSRTHFMTKNLGKIEDLLTPIQEGGE